MQVQQTASTDRSLFIHGLIYHYLFDPPLKESRRVAVELIPEGASVVDIACGTGQLCLDLRRKKRCRVFGGRPFSSYVALCAKVKHLR